jgi:hypothetical protein
MDGHVAAGACGITNRSRPRPRAGGLRRTLVAAALAAGALLSLASPALATEPNHVSFTLEGCRNNGGIELPDANGDVLCPDTIGNTDVYTTGNLGKGWNELDLVPFRITTGAGSQSDATTDYTVAIALDHTDNGHLGYDVISAATLNAGKSDAGCSVTNGPASTTTGGASLYRLITIHQAKGSTCVFDFYGRLAIGSHLYPG